MAQFPQKLTRKLLDRRGNNAMRVLSNDTGLVDFSSNDYLGLAVNENLYRTTLKLLQERNISNNGATGSRLLTGNSPLYAEVENMLCNLFDTEASLVFNSGYDANVGFFSSVPQRNDIVFYDEYIHASIRDGIKISNAKSYSFKHNNLDELNGRIKKLKNQGIRPEAEVYIVTESVFSMDGDSPDMDRLIGVCEKYNTRLVVDEAHAVGVLGSEGRGLLFNNVEQHNVFASIITFGKAWGGHGAAILCTNDLRDYLINFARSFIYTTGLPPHSLAHILAVSQYLETEEAKMQRKQLIKNIAYFKSQIKKLNIANRFIDSDSAIQCCVLNGNAMVKELARTLAIKGIDVRPILSPTVPQGEERLRFCIHSFNNENQITKALDVLNENILKSPSFIERN